VVWLLVPYHLLRILVVVGPAAALFVLVTALLSSIVERQLFLLLLGGAAAFVPAILVWRVVRRRSSFPFVFSLTNVLGALALAAGFADDAGRALRRHGDWFLGEARGAVARGARVAIADSADVLEAFDPHPALVDVVTIDERGAAMPAVALADWFHPLAGPERALPPNASTRFGAARPQPRPRECELGHCGVDLGRTIGQPVFAIHDGVVDRIVRDERDPVAGRYVIVTHKDGTIASRYLHLDSVRADLTVGMAVKGGELVGRLGRSGIYNSAPHLHFGLSFRDRGRDFYLDPEPYLRKWRLLSVEEALARAEPPRPPAPPPPDLAPRL
jgi:Peptidase family M23